jgi:phage tail sheath protein FI
MVASYKTPGVYIEEIPRFPPSVAPVETAIPAFIGYTEKAEDVTPGDLHLKPTRISSMVEYERYFGFPQKETAFTVAMVTMSTGMITGQKAVADLPETARSKHLMYYALQMFFANGGGPCYIVSVGLYKALGSALVETELHAGLEAVKKEDEPTLILFPEAQSLSSIADFKNLQDAALAQCVELTDRFVIMDVHGGTISLSDPSANLLTAVKNFRDDGIGTNNLKYGAAYAPNIETVLDFAVDESATEVQIAANAKAIIGNTNTNTIINGNFDIQGIQLGMTVSGVGIPAGDKVVSASIFTLDTTGDTHASTTLDGLASTTGIAVGQLVEGPQFSPGTTVAAVVDTTTVTLSAAAVGTATGAAVKFTGATITLSAPATATATGISVSVGPTAMLKDLQETDNQIYELAKAAIRDMDCKLPPSSAVAGIYAAVDNSRGVWKAPANVSVNAVIQPTIQFTNVEQDQLNVDVTAGKSVNAVRPFIGKGTLVWGARTLAGNDNEWRYINVRRLFIFVEESVKKATGQFVFEANDANTWVKVQGMIENFLTTLWRQGALQGIKPEHAFYVAVGLGKTMTALDILEGRMIVEIGMAAVRPAEFIILRFSHKMAES